MKKLLLLTCILFLSVLTITPAYSGPGEITIASEQWDDTTNADGSGLYWDILRAVYEPAGIKVTHKIKSYVGSSKLMQAKRVDAMIGAFEGEIKPEKGIYPKWNIDVERIDAIYLKSKTGLWMGQETIRNKKVGWIKGHNYEFYLDVNVIKHECTDQATAFRLLKKQKIDYYLNCDDDITAYIELNNVDVSDYIRKHCVSNKMYVVFAKTPRAQKYADVFDKRIPELIKSGKIKELFNKYSFKYPY